MTDTAHLFSVSLPSAMDSRLRRWLGLGLVALTSLGVTVAGCAFPVRATSLSPAPRANVMQAPANVVKFTLLSADIPDRANIGDPWDDDGTPPDPYVRVLRNGQLVYESEPVRDTLRPVFNRTLRKNLRAGPRDTLRIELWDDDGGGDDSLGFWQGTGLPSTALIGARSQVLLSSRATIEVQADAPMGHRGLGIEEYELRGSRLVVVRVAEQSPAGRAGIRAGDSIVAIGGRRVDDMTDGEAASELSLAAERRSVIEVRRGERTMEIEVDQREVWLSM